MTPCNCGSFAINDDPQHKLCDKCWRDVEIKRLRSALARLPACWRIDGETFIQDVPLIPGMTVWGRWHGPAKVVAVFRDEVEIQQSGGRFFRQGIECYDSQEAAEAAKKDGDSC
mgnify:CR=1 FL=1